MDRSIYKFIYIHNPGSVQGWDGWGFKQLGQVEGVPAMPGRLELGDL